MEEQEKNTIQLARIGAVVNTWQGLVKASQNRKKKEKDKDNEDKDRKRSTKRSKKIKKEMLEQTLLPTSCQNTRFFIYYNTEYKF